jgi:hypothetical protein
MFEYVFKYGLFCELKVHGKVLGTTESPAFMLMNLCLIFVEHVMQLSAGFAIAAASPVEKTAALSKCLRECTEYAVSTCGRGMSTSKLEHLCEVRLNGQSR